MSTLDPVRTPQRPGPGPIPEAVLHRLDLRVEGKITGLLVGDHPSANTGAGTELAVLREYQPGDDVRSIDWNVTARTTVPHIKTYVAERAVTTWLLLDTSASMGFGTQDRRKLDVAEGVARVVGSVATKHNNRLGFVSFGGIHRTLPPRQGRVGLVQLLTLLHDVATLEDPDIPEPNKAQSAGSLSSASYGAVAPTTGDLHETIRAAAFLSRSRAVLMVVSDFRAPLDSWIGTLGQAAARHDVICVEIFDPREEQLPDVGVVSFVDPESGQLINVDTSKRKLRERFVAAAAAERAEVRAAILRAGAAHIRLSTQGDWLHTLAQFLEARELAR